jgi:glyoxylase-like metal-dependent hydrolase (beta-lactamase superfamily II)
MDKISENIYAETGFRGCNPGFVVTTEGVVMIDSPQNPTNAIKWRDEIKKKGEVKYLINTEPHGDHVMGNFFFTGVVIAQEGTREAVLSSMSLETIKERVQAIDPDGVKYLEGYEIKAPSITFSDRLSIHLGGHTFELMHLPGHTASETAVYIPEERVVFTGDNIFYKTQTFMQAALPEEWLKSLEKIGELDVDWIVPGHGQVCNKDYLPEQAAFIKDWIGAVKEAISKGVTKEEAHQTISFIDRYPMDTGLEAMGEMVQHMNIDRLYELYQG